jgi:ParB-like chromosome segregation protein Spo0J
MKIVKRKISDLIKADYNPRKITEKQFDDIKKSIEKFGFVEPIVININPSRMNVIIGGHQRFEVAKKLKYKEVDCVELDLTLDQEKELNIRLNKNTGDFDFDILGNYFDVDDLIDYGFNPLELGLVDDIEEGEFPELKEGDKEPFQQMAFVLANDQAEIVKQALEDIKKTDRYKFIETYGNNNSNGNALYTIIAEWEEQKK